MSNCSSSKLFWVTEMLHPILETPETGYWDRLWAEVIKIIAWNQGIGNRKNWEIFRTKYFLTKYFLKIWKLYNSKGIWRINLVQKTKVVQNSILHLIRSSKYFWGVKYFWFWKSKFSNLIFSKSPRWKIFFPITGVQETLPLSFTTGSFMVKFFFSCSTL